MAKINGTEVVIYDFYYDAKNEMYCRCYIPTLDITLAYNVNLISVGE